MSESTTLAKIERLIVPIVSDLQLELYDLEFRGGVLRVTVDDRPAWRRVSTSRPSPWRLASSVANSTTTTRCRGITRSRSPAPASSAACARRPTSAATIGKTVGVRLRDIVTPEGERSERRLQGVLVAADETSATIRLDDAARTERVVPYEKIDRARTVFVWGPAQSPAKPAAARRRGKRQRRGASGARRTKGPTSPQVNRGGRSSMSNLDMSEAVRMLANEKGISVDTLLHVLADALATAYKRMPDAAEEAWSRSTPTRSRSRVIA